jgi:hypothetical protein
VIFFDEPKSQPTPMLMPDPSPMPLPPPRVVSPNPLLGQTPPGPGTIAVGPTAKPLLEGPAGAPAGGGLEIPPQTVAYSAALFNPWNAPAGFKKYPDGPPHSNKSQAPEPAPRGYFVLRMMETQAYLAKADWFVVYCHEWVAGAAKLKPKALDHVNRIATVAPVYGFPIVIEPSGDQVLDEARRLQLVIALAQYGLADAETRVIIAKPSAEGLRCDEIDHIGARLLSGAYGCGGYGYGGFGGGYHH